MSEDWEDEAYFDHASILREFMAANKWTNSIAAATWGVSPQTVCNWRRTGRYSDAIYRQIYESDWGQMRFNPEWPDKFERCGVGYTWEEEMLMDAKVGGSA
jgi:predicted N-acyltransferase